MKEVTTPITTNVTMYEAADGKQFSDKEDCLTYEKHIEDQNIYNEVFTDYEDHLTPLKIKNLRNKTFEGYATNFVGLYTGGKKNRNIFEQFLINENSDYDVYFSNENKIKNWDVPLYVAFDITDTMNADSCNSQIDVYFYSEEDVDMLFNKKYEMLKQELTAMDFIRIKSAEQAN